MLCVAARFSTASNHVRAISRTAEKLYQQEEMILEGSECKKTKQTRIKFRQAREKGKATSLTIVDNNFLAFSSMLSHSGIESMLEDVAIIGGCFEVKSSGNLKIFKSFL